MKVPKLNLTKIIVIVVCLLVLFTFNGCVQYPKLELHKCTVFGQKTNINNCVYTTKSGGL